MKGTCGRGFQHSNRIEVQRLQHHYMLTSIARQLCSESYLLDFSQLAQMTIHDRSDAAVLERNELLHALVIEVCT